MAAGAGYALGRRFQLDLRSLSRVAFYVFSPCLVFDSLTHSDLSGALFAQIGAVSLGVTVLVALTAGTRRSGMLLALMLLPLCVPVVIFAAGAVAAAQQGLPWISPIAWLGAALSLTLVLAPLACAVALRIALDA